MKKYIMYVDDTGNSNKKNSIHLSNEIKTFCGVILDEERASRLKEAISKGRKELEKKCGAKEFHFTEIYNRKPPFDKFDFQKDTLPIIKDFAFYFKLFSLPIFTLTLDKTNDKFYSIFKPIANQIADITKLPKKEEGALFLMHSLFAKKYVKEEMKGSLTKIVCDEGLRKAGVENTIKFSDGSISFEFVRSQDDPLVQLADFSAWFLNRMKSILDKKIDDYSEIDKKNLEIANEMSSNYVNLPDYQLEENFDYDRAYEDV